MRRDHSLNCEPVTQDTALYELVGFSSERERGESERASAAALSRELFSSREKIAPVRKLQALSNASKKEKARRCRLPAREAHG